MGGGTIVAKGTQAMPVGLSVASQLPGIHIGSYLKCRVPQCCQQTANQGMCAKINPVKGLSAPGLQLLLMVKTVSHTTRARFTLGDTSVKRKKNMQ